MDQNFIIENYEGRDVYTGTINKLNQEDVFVFGANLRGFHGAGAAGFASFNISGNVWRKFNYNKYPNGTKFKWNIKGTNGFQEGTDGKSYAIPTIKFPGKKRSLSEYHIVKSISNFYIFAIQHPEYRFLVAYKCNSKNLNGYNDIEMAQMFKNSITTDIPSNVIFEKEFYELICNVFKSDKYIQDMSRING